MISSHFGQAGIGVTGLLVDLIKITVLIELIFTKDSFLNIYTMDIFRYMQKARVIRPPTKTPLPTVSYFTGSTINLFAIAVDSAHWKPNETRAR